jgi:small subunit ribosomal protein S20
MHIPSDRIPRNPGAFRVAFTNCRQRLIDRSDQILPTAQAEWFTSLRKQEWLMANTKSARKMVRKIARKTEVNKARRSRVRTLVRNVEEAIASGDQTAAATALKATEPELARAAQKGLMHSKTASRKVSRLTHRIKSMGAKTA